MKKLITVLVAIMIAAQTTGVNQTITAEQLQAFPSPRIDARLIPQLSCGDALGTGFVAAPNLIITADHVVAGGGCEALDNSSRLAMRSQSTPKSISVKDHDVSNDYAIMYSRRSLGQKAYTVNCSGLVTGDTYWLIGYAGGRPELHVASGIAQNIYVNGRHKTGVTMHLRAVRATAFPGMSGGPVLNRKGEVVAIVSAAATNGSGLALVKEMADTKVCDSADK